MLRRGRTVLDNAPRSEYDTSRILPTGRRCTGPQLTVGGRMSRGPGHLRCVPSPFSSCPAGRRTLRRCGRSCHACACLPPLFLGPPPAPPARLPPLHAGARRRGVPHPYVHDAPDWLYPAPAAPTGHRRRPWPTCAKSNTRTPTTYARCSHSSSPAKPSTRSSPNRHRSRPPSPSPTGGGSWGIRASLDRSDRSCRCPARKWPASPSQLAKARGSPRRGYSCRPPRIGERLTSAAWP